MGPAVKLILVHGKGNLELFEKRINVT